MRGGRPARLLVAAAVLATACGGTAGTSSRGGRSPTPADTPTRSAAAVVERVDWRLAEPPTGNGLRLVVAIPSAVSCGSFDDVDVSETAEAVVVETSMRRLVPGEGEACTDDLAFEEVAVTLEDDLAGRRLEGCDAPPGGSIYFDEPVPPEGCTGAVLTDR